MSANVSKKIKIVVSNAQAGQNITVNLYCNGVPVVFSAGPDFSQSSGISITSQSGDLPLTVFSITSATAEFSTSSGGGGGGSISFTLDAYLVAEAGIQLFSMSNSSDDGVEVTAGLDGNKQQIINRSKTPFTWNPQ